ncbi:ABC transporter permease [Streptomyces sp. NPDC005438]|uniref:ABC transporter permease n=1 Tax=Streptomyces sp. NPDC005438 TaxID=3156880 RepID=UPI0033A15B23
MSPESPESPHGAREARDTEVAPGAQGARPTVGTVTRPSLLVDSALLARRHLLLMSRRPASLMGALVLPLVFAFLFFVVFGKVVERRTGLGYEQYLLPAVVIQAILFAAMSAAILAVEDVTGGMVRRLRGMSVARSSPVLGLVGAELCRVLAATVALTLFGLLVGFRFHGAWGALGFLLFALAFALVVCVGFATMGLAIARAESVSVLANLIFFPLLLLSNAFVPSEAFPDWLEPVVTQQPISRVADALRALTDEGAAPADTLLIALAWLAGGLLVCVPLAGRALGRNR